MMKINSNNVKMLKIKNRPTQKNHRVSPTCRELEINDALGIGPLTRFYRNRDLWLWHQADNVTYTGLSAPWWTLRALPNTWQRLMASPSAVPGIGMSRFDWNATGGRTRMMTVYVHWDYYQSIDPVQYLCGMPIVIPCVCKAQTHLKREVLELEGLRMFTIIAHHPG